MRHGGTSWIVAGLACLSLLSACGGGKRGASAPPGDDSVDVTEEQSRTPIPGMDFWSERRRAAARRGEKPRPADPARALRHKEVMQAGVPLEYRHRRNPYPAATGVTRDGGRLYRARCARCHGAGGSGDGVASRDLAPPPAFLAHLIKRPRAVDAYLLWTISEGGARFGTEMPAYRGILSEDQMWRIVGYMRAGFPKAGAK